MENREMCLVSILSSVCLVAGDGGGKGLEDTIIHHLPNESYLSLSTLREKEEGDEVHQTLNQTESEEHPTGV